MWQLFIFTFTSRDRLDCESASFHMLRWKFRFNFFSFALPVFPSFSHSSWVSLSYVCVEWWKKWLNFGQTFLDHSKAHIPLMSECVHKQTLKAQWGFHEIWGKFCSDSEKLFLMSSFELIKMSWEFPNIFFTRLWLWLDSCIFSLKQFKHPRQQRTRKMRIESRKFTSDKVERMKGKRGAETDFPLIKNSPNTEKKVIAEAII